MFKFSIRDLLWLTVVVALGVAWFLDRRDLDAELRYTTHKLGRLRRAVEIDQWPAAYNIPSSNSSAPAPNPPKD